MEENTTPDGRRDRRLPPETERDAEEQATRDAERRPRWEPHPHPVEDDDARKRPSSA